MLHQQLKEYTAVNHASLEKKLVTKIKSIRNRGDYTNLLRLMYGFYNPLEACIDQFISKDNIPDYSLRRKSAALLRDLNALERFAGNVVCEHLPVINSFESALGSMYVLEGSTLGGVIISTMVRRQLNDDAVPLDFFVGYGDDNLRMWETFKKYLNHNFAEAKRHEIKSAANQTFLSFINWVDLYAKNEL